jgi:hypothetical protein
MISRSHSKQTSNAALAYHEQERRDLIVLAWFLNDECLQDTAAYRETLRRIAWHERLIAQLGKVRK